MRQLTRNPRAIARIFNLLALSYKLECVLPDESITVPPIVAVAPCKNSMRFFTNNNNLKT